MVLVDIEPPRLKVHVSCCDADIGFVNKLVSGLERFGRFDVSVTPKQQAERTGWRDRIGVLIAEADTVLFVLSGDAVSSAAFSSEAELAAGLSKRMLSLIAGPLRVADVPTSLASLKHRRFDQESLFNNKLELLVTLLDADADWVRMHTSMYSRASAWKNSGYADKHLLTGSDIKAAKTWTFGRPYTAPKPTMLHVQFIQASEVVYAAGNKGSTGPGPHIKRARRKSKPIQPAPAPLSRRSRPVPETLALPQLSWPPAQPAPVAQPALAVAGNAATIAVAPVKNVTQPAPAPSLALAANEQPCPNIIDLPTAQAAVPAQPAAADEDKPKAEHNRQAEALPLPEPKPLQLTAAAPEVGKAEKAVIHHNEIDDLLASLVPDDDDDAAEPIVATPGDVSVTDHLVHQNQEPADPEVVETGAAPQETPAEAPAPEAPALQATAPEETEPQDASEPAPADLDVQDGDEVSCAPDPIDLMRAKNISGIQKDVGEIELDDLFQLEDTKAQRGQNRLIAAMASCLIVVAGVAMWQMFDDSHSRANANDQTLAQLADVENAGGETRTLANGGFIERALGKVECMFNPSTPHSDKCLQKSKPAGSANPDFQ